MIDRLNCCPMNLRTPPRMRSCQMMNCLMMSRSMTSFPNCCLSFSMMKSRCLMMKMTSAMTPMMMMMMTNSPKNFPSLQSRCLNQLRVNFFPMMMNCCCPKYSRRCNAPVYI